MRKITHKPYLLSGNTFLLVIVLFPWSTAFGNEEENADGTIPDFCYIQKEDGKRELKDACEIRSRLSAYEPNYAVIQGTYSDDSNFDDDEESLEVHYSFRYLFTRPHCRSGYDFISRISEEDSRACVENYENRYELFFTYTGEFDFYAGTRDSSPVINRISNPALHYRKIFRGARFEWVNFSVEHQSNGQTTEIDETTGGRLRTQIAFENKDLEYFDGISRGSNFYKIQTKFRVNDDSDLYASYKYYLSHDSDVNWGPDASDDPSFEDYDKLRFIYTYRWTIGSGKAAKTVEASFDWLIGDEGFDTDSYDIDFMYPIGSDKFAFPLYFRYHDGPMNTLSNYTLDQKTFGVGIKLRPF